MGKLILGLLAVLGLLGTGLTVAAMLPAGTATITAVGGTAIIGQDITVALNVTGASGVGALTIDIQFDPSVLAPVSCTPTGVFQLAVCNPNYPGNRVRIAGVSTVGISGDVRLMDIVFHAIALGTSPLDVQVVTFADTTPVDMAVQDVDGTVNVTPVATPTSNPTPSPTSSISPTPFQCGKGDQDGDGRVTVLDVIAYKGHWGCAVNWP